MDRTRNRSKWICSLKTWNFLVQWRRYRYRISRNRKNPISWLPKSGSVTRKHPKTWFNTPSGKNWILWKTFAVSFLTSEDLDQGIQGCENFGSRSYTKSQIQRDLKGTVQRQSKLGSFDRSSLKREARCFFRKIRPSPIPWGPLEVPRYLISSLWTVPLSTLHWLCFLPSPKERKPS